MSGAASVTFGPRSATYWGILWGVGVGIVDYLSIAPIDDWGSLQRLLYWLFYWMMPYWCVVGCLIVALADRYESIAHRGRFIAAFLSLSVLAAALHSLLSMAFIPLATDEFPGFARYVAEAGVIRPNWASLSTISLIQLWENLFYGGLLVAARIFTMRVERTRHLLHQSEMARSRTEVLIDAARLQALQSQIDPNLLLDSMQELEQRYRASPRRAESLLVALVEFLRYAMHGLRVPVSTLDAELQLARAFSQLQHERGVEGTWRIDEEQAPPAAPFKFPSLLMLRLLALGGGNGRPVLRVRVEGGHMVLCLNGLSQSISPELRQQIRVRLYALYGERFRFECHLPTPHQLRISLPTTAAPSGESHA